jgi:hypothetical protein
MPNWGITAAENSSRKITLENQQISHLKCCGGSKIRYSEESEAAEDLFENRRWKIKTGITNL